MDNNKMPTNSFDHFFLSWVPVREQLTRPYYLSIANQLENDILSGRLASGTKLPPQRELADYLDLNFTTVTQAYNLCRERNLIYGVVGKGTFVSPLPGTEYPCSFLEKKTLIDMGQVTGFDSFRSPVIEATKNVLQKSYLDQLFNCSEPAGHLHQRTAGVQWMKLMDVHTDSNHTAVFPGAQNIICTTLLALFHTGDKLLTDEYTYFNLIGAAKLSRIQLVPVKGDRYGMIPEEMARICRNNRIRGIFLMPNCANPTTITMSESRKDKIADLIAKYKLILLEDDNTGILPLMAAGQYHSMFSRLPEQTIHISNSTMAVCGGLRVSFAAFPERFRTKMLNTLYHLNLKVSALDAEIVTELILSGKAVKLQGQRNSFAQKRNQIFDEIFPGEKAPGSPGTFFRFLPIGDLGLNGVEIEQDLFRQNVRVFHAYRFTVSAKAGNFLRIAVTAPDSDDDLRKGLKIIRNYITEKGNRKKQ